MSNLELRRLSPEWTAPLADFFQVIRTSGDDRVFHPHPFTADEARRLCHFQGRDLYYVLIDGERIVGYAMLRGWDEGYTVPSLGIAVHPDARGTGTGHALMNLLHGAARSQGADQVRLKVYETNVRALQLYQKMGYRFEDRDGDQLVGKIDL